MVLAIVLLTRSQGFKTVVLMCKVFSPFGWRQFTNIVKAVVLTYQHTVVLTFECPLSEKESSTQQHNSSDKVDNAEKDHQPELIVPSFSYFLNKIKICFRYLIISTYISLSRQYLSFFLTKGHRFITNFYNFYKNNLVNLQYYH